MPTSVPVPELGESIKEAKLIKWHKADGDRVQTDEPICELETDKANVDIPAPSAGILHRLKNEGEMVNVGEPIAQIDAATGTTTPTAKVAPAASAPPKKSAAPPPPVPAAKKEPAPAPPVPAAKRKDSSPAAPAAGSSTAPYVDAPITFDSSGLARVPMSKIRKRIAQTLVEAQNTAAILTTFNEIDLTTIVDLRNRYKERFQELYGVGLGFMSFFARAVVLALKEFPKLNAFIQNDEVIYHQYVNLGIAVSTDRGLAVPVLKDADQMSFAQFESEIKRVAGAVREGKLALHELAGGTFTITNGGVFGSLLSTPILNPPQSGILGMHTIQKRPMVVNDKIEIRHMMYVALSYDHRLVDGRESVSFLVRIKQFLEDPGRLMLEV
jgi:2-oxoglutarate dehydrogenase E2 component (dihydrolipoamide succinyltransferase)